MGAGEVLLRQRIAEDLSKCTEAQQELFGRMYPDGPSDDQLSRAYDQISRTLVKNAAKAGA